MKNLMSLLSIALCAISVADVCAYVSNLEGADASVRQLDANPYSYFVESELDRSYEQGNNGNIYDALGEEGFDNMSLLELAGNEGFLGVNDEAGDVDDELSLLEADDEAGEVDDELSLLEADDEDGFDANVAFLETEDEFKDDGDESFIKTDADADEVDRDIGAIAAAEGDLMENDASSYVPIRRRAAGKPCNDMECEIESAQVADSEPVIAEPDEAQPTEDNQATDTWSASVRKHALKVTIIALVVICLCVWLFVYTPVCIMDAKERAQAWYNSRRSSPPVIPEVAETEPLVAS
ncbi:uncharacterized protein BcabD6B2_34430 [Babesia caballi]|uniref:Membrane protein, putative n=1 Tax=Babesia caballi TaxID=5871 RepID=A0AAV4LW77_BABCB|nr:membrane protein, putative [Babesia caballi]